jgi:ABC-type multidrug transport system ATPase subunit
MDEDVKAEEEAIFSGKLNPNAAIVIQNLTKIFPGNFSCLKGCKSSEPFAAVKDLCLSIEKDTLFCLLGPNGAGKTTTISTLVGFHSASAGDALVYGHSINNDMATIQSMIGLCPQFDLLWGELTGKEHLMLYAGLRSLPKETILGESIRLLEEVGLSAMANVRTASYSGGERRRLSVAISLIGKFQIFKRSFFSILKFLQRKSLVLRF